MRGAVVAGVDGCRAGWVAAIGPSENGPLWLVVSESLEQLLASHPRVVRWAIDMPIGLSESGARECDRLARERLGPARRASVFSAPPRACLGASGYSHACRVAERVSGKKISKQAWNLAPKIREVNRLVDRVRARKRVFETHPELCFSRMAGGAISASKKSEEGFTERLRTLKDALKKIDIDRFVLQSAQTRGLALDDTLDALACWGAAARRYTGTAISLPAEPPLDASGIPMAIRY